MQVLKNNNYDILDIDGNIKRVKHKINIIKNWKFEHS